MCQNLKILGLSQGFSIVGHTELPRETWKTNVWVPVPDFLIWLVWGRA